MLDIFSMGIEPNAIKSSSPSPDDRFAHSKAKAAKARETGFKNHIKNTIATYEVEDTKPEAPTHLRFGFPGTNPSDNS